MIVIYHDVGGCHSSAVAANIHINKLPMDRLPLKEELMSLTTFDKITKNELGKLIYIGRDEFDSKVYTLCRRHWGKLVIPAISDLYKELNGGMEGLVLANTSPSVNNIMRIGGFSSRVIGLVSFGRPIVADGTLKAYYDIVDIVKKTKEYMRNNI
ncbi:DUF3189 family protein [Clostridium folliculivorans]|uniref:DUF3189 family protein n=1 Tax=Clostridium folliculivorans TaxID=2886038 RepID=UPI0021C396F0|nr:DUF3189 family protein [Clostridium folliculivorans]GKU30214.1 hypothetical protein CFB3_23210 [Clostridium folliculivorans]